MAKQLINIGTSANDGTGTSLRDGGDLINDNFNEIYTAFGDGSTLSSGLITASSTTTFTNKTLDLGGTGNSVTGSLAEFNTALQGDSFVSLTGSETLTNKTLTSPAIDTITRTGDFTIDASGDIKLDAAGGDIEINNNGTVIGKLSDSSNDFQLTSIVQDKDFVIKGNDGGSFVTALRLDMSEAGNATFNANVSVGTLTVRGGHITLPGQLTVSDVLNASNGLTTDNLTIVNGGNEIDVSSGDLTLDVAGDIFLDAAGNEVKILNAGTELTRFVNNSQNLQIKNPNQDKDITIQGNDGGSNVNALTLDMSEAGAATFNSTIATTGLTINSAYTFPTADGSANQVLQTDGSGNLSFADASGGGTSWQAVKTSSFTAVAGEGYFIDTTSAAITMTLPASPSQGDEVSFIDYAGTADSNNITIARNGSNIAGAASDLTVSVERAANSLVYVDSTQGWLLTSK